MVASGRLLTSACSISGVPASLARCLAPCSLCASSIVSLIWRYLSFTIVFISGSLDSLPWLTGFLEVLIPLQPAGLDSQSLSEEDSDCSVSTLALNLAWKSLRLHAQFFFFCGIYILVFSPLVAEASFSCISLMV